MNHKVGIAMAIALALVACGPEIPPVSGGSSVPAADYRDPVTTYRTYLEAVKRDDRSAAEACFMVINDTPGALDLMVGMWISNHRFGKIVAAKFGKRECRFLRDDCTDEALDRTLARLAKSTFKTKGGTAKLTIQWQKYDGTDDAVFEFGDDTIPFRKVRGQWKIECEVEDPKELFAPGSWGWAFREGMRMLDEASDGMESGKLKTWEQVTGLLEQRMKKMEKQFAKDHHDP